MGNPSRVRTAAVAALAAGAVWAGVGTAHPAAAAGFDRCSSDHPFIEDLKADGVSCAKARRVANAWFSEAVSEGSVDSQVRVQGFSCRWSSDTLSTKCKDGRKVVKFRTVF